MISQYFIGVPGNRTDTPPAALRSLCLIFQSVQMREIFAGVPTVWQRCASPVNSRQSIAHK